MNSANRIALTGFMGVGKSSVARHLARKLGSARIDLDAEIEKSEKRIIADLIESVGIAGFRLIEAENLERVLSISGDCVLSLGGGTWTIEQNRERIIEAGFTCIWLESTFEHCWRNISSSRKDRPLARDKESARRLFDERKEFYCLSDWHFVIKPGMNSSDVAKMIFEQIS